MKTQGPFCLLLIVDSNNVKNQEKYENCAHVLLSSSRKTLRHHILKYNMSSYATPLQLGPLLLKNRVIMASLTRDRNLIPGPLQVEYYTQRAGAGLILSEGTLIEPLGSEWSNARKFIMFIFCYIII
jgi:hypothetical protein